MKTLLAFILLFGSFTATAQQIDLSQLPEATRVEIQQKINQAQAQTSPQQVSEWVGVGKEIGIAFKSIAGELNVQINDFITSPAGKIAMAILIWKIFLKDFLDVLLSLGLFIIGISLLYTTYKRQFIYEYAFRPWLFGLFNTKNITKKERVEKSLSDVEIWLMVFYGLLAIIGVAATIVSH